MEKGEKGRRYLIQARNRHLLPLSVKERGFFFFGHARRSNTIQMRFNLIRLKPDLVWLLCHGGRCRRRRFILVINAKKYTGLDCECKKNTASKVKQWRKKNNCLLYLLCRLRHWFCFCRDNLEGRGSENKPGISKSLTST